jgi:pyruvate,water dikinase
MEKPIAPPANPPDPPAHKPEWKVIVDLLRGIKSPLLNRIGRKMMNYLVKRNVKQVDQLVEKLTASRESLQASLAYNPNEPMPRFDLSLLETFIDDIFEIAADEIPADEISRMVSLWLKQEQSRFLAMAAEKRDVPLGDISDALHRFSLMADAQKSLSPEENMGIRVALIRRFFSENLEYINVTKKYTGVQDFVSLLSRTIGPARGNGKLGGKAAGLFRAERILMNARPDHVVLRNLAVPKTWYITSDGIIDFLHFNALEEMPMIKYRDPAEIRKEYLYLEQIYKNSALSPEIIAGLNMALDDFGDKPLIVRSSSLLEDSLGSSFAGKYKSLFVANQGTKRERLAALVDAIVEVYASVFGPDPLEYRRERGLLDFNEEMAVLIEEVVGRRVGKYYFPAFAGVAFSRNEFRWSPRIRRNDGIIRLVAGLGTRAVDRVGDDYPVLVSSGQPGLRVNVSPEDCLRYSQKNIDVINLETRRFESHSLEEMIQECGHNFPGLSQIISLYRDGQIMPSVGMLLDLKQGIPLVTFSKLIERSPFIPTLKTIMKILEDALGFPVDIEFACEGDVHYLHLLQCRPQSQSSGAVTVTMPVDVPLEDQVFSAHRYVTTGELQNVEYVVYVDPLEYDAISTFDDLVQVGRVIGELNNRLPRSRFILMGPGRWGSRGDIKLGVRVTYSDINNTAMLIEIARNKKGYVPELSFGTHFFQDLVEASIRYLPLYPDDPGTVFNEAFLTQSLNSLRKLIPAARSLEHVIRVIHVPKAANGATLSVVMDGDADRALAYLKRG